MSLNAAKEALNNSEITPEELFNRIEEINVEIGHLYCRCKIDPQLTPALIQREEILVELKKKYQEILKNNA